MQADSAPWRTIFSSCEYRAADGGGLIDPNGHVILLKSSQVTKPIMQFELCKEQQHSKKQEFFVIMV
jgi:hypothetical protein